MTSCAEATDVGLLFELALLPMPNIRDLGRSLAPAVLGRAGESGAVVGRALLRRRERFEGGSAVASVVVDAFLESEVDGKGVWTRDEERLSRSL